MSAASKKKSLCHRLIIEYSCTLCTIQRRASRFGLYKRRLHKKLFSRIFDNVFSRDGNNASYTVILGLVVPVCYTQEPLLMFRRIFTNAYVNPH